MVPSMKPAKKQDISSQHVGQGVSKLRPATFLSADISPGRYDKDSYERPSLTTSVANSSEFKEIGR